MNILAELHEGEEELIVGAVILMGRQGAWAALLTSDRAAVELNRQDFSAPLFAPT
jgi:hypothetical protein